MPMLLNSRKITFLGLLLAITVILIVLSGIIEFNTLFLLAGASFCVGIAIRETNLRLGFGFLIAAILLGLILAPNKLYCITFSALGTYIFLSELAFEKVITMAKVINKNQVLWIIKFLIFNSLFVPMLLLFPHLIYPGDIKIGFIYVILFSGQVLLILFDYAYNYFQITLWNRLRKYIKL